MGNYNLAGMTKESYWTLDGKPRVNIPCERPDPSDCLNQKDNIVYMSYDVDTPDEFHHMVCSVCGFHWVVFGKIQEQKTN